MPRPLSRAARRSAQCASGRAEAPSSLTPRIPVPPRIRVSQHMPANCLGRSTAFFWWRCSPRQAGSHKSYMTRSSSSFRHVVEAGGANGLTRTLSDQQPLDCAPASPAATEEEEEEGSASATRTSAIRRGAAVVEVMSAEELLEGTPSSSSSCAWATTSTTAAAFVAVRLCRAAPPLHRHACVAGTGRESAHRMQRERERETQLARWPLCWRRGRGTRGGCELSRAQADATLSPKLAAAGTAAGTGTRLCASAVPRKLRRPRWR